VFTNLQKQLGEIQFGKEQKGRPVFEQQEEQIKRNIKLLEIDMANAVTEAFTTEDGIGNVEQYGIELKKVYDLTKQLEQAQLSELNISNQFATGWTDAFNKYIDSATNAATMASNAFNSITSNMNSAIDNFVETGKFSFKDFARSVIQDLAKIELKKQAALAMSGASSFLGSLFGGFFAEGGNPPVNKPSIVGENGPELFVPKTAGTIVPNGGSVANAAQGNTYITNNISAIDAKSVAQLFAENRKTLFGSVQMAQKELSYGR
jgi:phage-related minor tail protein